MKAFLMYRDRDFDTKKDLPSNAGDLTQDLELTTLFKAMAGEDEFLFDVAKKALLSSLTDRASILYRQDILRDCIRNEAVIREIYGLAFDTIESKRKNFWLYGSSRYPNPGLMLHTSVEVLEMLVVMLRKLRTIADTCAPMFASEGFSRLFAMLEKELDDGYFTAIRDHLGELRFRNGVLISAGLGEGAKGKDYVLRKPNRDRRGWLRRIVGMVEKKKSVYSFRLADRDESGAKALTDLQNRGINLVANALSQSTDHILAFFAMLRTELAFYVGCLNLRGRLAALGEPMAFPEPEESPELRHSFRGLYDPCLALNMNRTVTGNGADADGKTLMIVTGANQGGKSTFLRSIGLAQLMMQCGMFAPAEAYRSTVCSGVFTHYKREEDATMKSGKFDEEMSRMSKIADGIRPGATIFFNESFAATNEREGSEIARQIVSALIEKRIRVCFVTHQFAFAHGFHATNGEDAVFLRAERRDDGTRTFKIVEGEPLETSYGEDLYARIFEAEPRTSPA
ncbi:MAG: MutS-related protein [Rectinemataceae bacterium]